MSRTLPHLFRTGLLALLLLAGTHAQAQTTYGDVAGNPTNHYPNHACSGSPVGPAVRVFGDDVPPPHQAYAYFEDEPTPPSGFFTNPTAFCFEVTYVATNVWADGSYTQSYHDKIAQWYVGSGVTPYGPYPSSINQYGQVQEGQSKGAAIWNSTAYGGSCASGAAQLNSGQSCSMVSSSQWRTYADTYTNGGSPTTLYVDSGARSCFSECAASGYQGCTEQRRYDQFSGVETVTCIVNPSSSNVYQRPSETTFQGGEPRYETNWTSYVNEAVVQYQCSPPGQYSCVPAPAPTASLYASPSSIAYGGSTALVHSCTNATSASISSYGGVSPSSGTSYVGPGSTTTYTLTCSGAGGTAYASATVTVVYYPNLYSGIGNSSTIVAGQTATFSGATYNNGDTTASGSFYDLFLVYDTNYNYSSQNGSNYWAYTSPVYSSAIGSGGGLSRTGYYTFLNPGTFYYRLCADWGGGVSEKNEGDNCSGFATVTVRPTAPSGLTYSCNLAGTSATVSWNPTPGAAYGYYLRGSLPNYDHYGSNSITYSVTPGQSYSFSVYAENTPSNYSDPSSTTISCAGTPNLYPYTGGAVSGTATQPITLSGSTYNYGSVTAPAGFYDLFLIYDTNYNVVYANGSTYWANTNPVYSGAIAPGGSVGRTGTYTFNTAGTYYYRFCTDWGGQVTESNEGDNCGGFSTVSVAAALPDLTAGGVSVSQTIPGRNTTLSAAAANQGIGSSGAFPMLFQVANAAQTQTVALLNSGYISLTPGESYTTSASWTPSAGTYSIRACANYNTAWTAITTEGPPGYYGNNCGPWTTVTFQNTGSLSCTTSVASAKVGDTVTYTAVPSNGAGSPYSWNDGQGGSYGSGSSVSRTFTAVGNYSMSVGADNTIQPSYTCTSGGMPYITVGCAAPNTASISSNVTRVRQGGTAILTWSGAGINTSCVLSGPGVSQTVPANSCSVPTQTTQTPALTTQSRYCVTCDGSIQQCVTVNVVPLYEEF